MSISRFTVLAQLDGAGGKKKGTVLIDRDTGLVTVRPLHSHSTYQMKLSDLADYIVKQMLLAGVPERFSTKKARRKT